MLDNIFNNCCDLIRLLANTTNISYGYLNMLIFYIIQPCIYISILIWEIVVLWKQNKVSKWVFSIPIFIIVTAIYILLREYVGADLEALCYDKIESMTLFAQSNGLTYVFFNIYVFIVLFLIVIFAHILFLIFRKTSFAWLIFIGITFMSPYLITVFFT